MGIACVINDTLRLYRKAVWLYRWLNLWKVRHPKDLDLALTAFFAGEAQVNLPGHPKGLREVA
jgi:hypothetical protein